MNSIPLLIIGAPAVLAVIAFKKAAKAEDDKTGGHPPDWAFLPPKRTPDWAFPPKWHPPVSKTGESR